MDEGLFIYRLLIILNSLVKTIYERTTMYKRIALVTLLLSASSFAFAAAEETKRKKSKFVWSATEKTCGKIDASIKKVKADIKANKAPAKRLKKAEKKKAECVAKGL